MQPTLPQASTTSRFNARRWLTVGCILVCYCFLARVPLLFVATWWGAGEPNWSSALNERQRMADWMLLTHSLDGLTRADVIAKLGEPEPAEYNATGEDMAYILGSARGILTFDALEAFVLRLDANGKVVEATIHRD